MSNRTEIKPETIEVISSFLTDGTLLSDPVLDIFDESPQDVINELVGSHTLAHLDKDQADRFVELCRRGFGGDSVLNRLPTAHIPPKE